MNAPSGSRAMLRVMSAGVTAFAALLLAACALAANPAAAPVSPGEDPTALLQVPEGFAVELVADGLAGPTQMVRGPDGRLWVAHLNGGENAAAGQVVAIDTETGDRRLLLDGLNKPTGIAVTSDALWVATRREILRAPLRPSRSGGPEGWVAESPATVLADLPFNGRSNGTLTVTPWGTLLYETSGSQLGGMVAEGSARLWELDPVSWQRPSPRLVASGLKGAYAHAIDDAGRLWITEIGDDPVNGGPPPDELNVMDAPAPDTEGSGKAPPDFGWPRCFGNAQPATNLGGTEELCAGTVAPAALFAPRSTPVSVAVAPWDSRMILVALWLTNQVVAVAADSEAEGSAGVTPFLAGIINPQSLLPWDNGSLLVAEFATGRIFRIARAP